FSPLSENVYGYTIKKLQVKSLLNIPIKTELREDSKTDTTILTEKWLEAQDSLIGGYADIIINLNGYTKLSDFKSGKILLEEGEIKEEYVDQLKLYAYLHNEVYGKYPDELSIIDLEKKEYPVAYTPKECEVLASKSRDALSEINRLIEMDELKALAKPNVVNCKSCLYRPACNYYWELPISETDSIFRDIRGTVAKVRQFRNGNLNVTLNLDDKELTVCYITSDYLPFLTGAVGREVEFYNVKQGIKPESYQALKTTKIYEV
ncbi:MAG TPA: PD-(D/E)XK nuclease family protein, partial [Prolixibacteraceae bacterium]|nr:PD-(D/E)XK nuclease family protein [Prolixibacteraceae bacterium]